MNRKNEVLKIAIPAVFETLFITFTSIIDSKMISSLGTAAISAIAVTNQPKLFIFCFFFAINTVISTTVATKLGKGDRAEANKCFLMSLFIVLAGSCVFGFLSVVLSEPILALCSGQQDTMAMSISYFRIIMGGMLFNHLFTAINAGLRGCGYTRVTFRSNVVSCLTNILLNYCLITGHFGFPALGITGAAIATVAGTFVALLYSVIYLYRSNAFISLLFCRQNRLSPGVDTIRELFGFWRHVFGENLLTRVGFLLTSSITARAGSFAMAVYSVGMHLMNINYAIGSGFQASGVALIGRSNGEGRADRIDSFAKTISRFGLIFSLILSVLIVLFAGPYYGLFDDEPDFVQTGVFVCYMIAVISPIQVLKIIYTGFLQGLSQMKQSMLAGVISTTIIQPICCLIMIRFLSLGIWGIWMSILISNIFWLLLTRFAYVRYRKSSRKRY